MKTIHKIPLALINMQCDIALPENATLLCVQMQHARPYLWALVNTDAPMTLRRIEMFGTGHPIDEAERTYIGTVQDHIYVWHFFERL
jgi:hypothetical protein